MELLGVEISVEIENDEPEVNIRRKSIIKQTEKSIIIEHNHDLVFDCRTRIEKETLGSIHIKNYENLIKRKIWVIDDGSFSEDSLIQKLKESIIEEIEKRSNQLSIFKKLLNIE